MSDSVAAPPSDTVELREPASVQRPIASSATQPASARGARYEQLLMLGKGAMGAVYLVRDRETGEQLALKKQSAAVGCRRS